MSWCLLLVDSGKFPFNQLSVSKSHICSSLAWYTLNIACACIIWNEQLEIWTRHFAWMFWHRHRLHYTPGSNFILTAAFITLVSLLLDWLVFKGLQSRIATPVKKQTHIWLPFKVLATAESLESPVSSILYLCFFSFHIYHILLYNIMMICRHCVLGYVLFFNHLPRSSLVVLLMLQKSGKLTSGGW